MQWMIIFLLCLGHLTQDVLAVNAKLFEKRRIEVASVAPIVKLSTTLLRNQIECAGTCLSDSVCSGFVWNPTTATCKIFNAQMLAGDNTAMASDGYVDSTLMPVDGHWAPWTDWGGCSLICNTGTQVRTRACNSPNYGGLRICPSTGVSSETQNCNTNPCPYVTKFKILTSTSWFSDMDSGSAVNFAIWNVYGQGCGTPWLYGPAGFGTGDTFTATDCNGFIMPNRVVSQFRASHKGTDGWNGEYVKVYLNDGTVYTCQPNSRSSIELDGSDYAYLPCF